MMALQRLRVSLIFLAIPFVSANAGTTATTTVASTTANAAPSTLPKILCLHGAGESGPILKGSITSLTTALSSEFQFVFTTAPYIGSGHFQGGFLWYIQQASTDPNWAKNSVSQLNNLITTQGPFVGILGFSQGSAFAAYYLSQAPANSFQFAMLFCGFLPQQQTGMQIALNAASPFNGIPALVWMGAKDTIIPNYETAAQAAKFTNPTVVTSALGSHAVPDSSDSTFNQVIAFANAQHAAPSTGTTATVAGTTANAALSTATTTATAAISTLAPEPIPTNVTTTSSWTAWDSSSGSSDSAGKSLASSMLSLGSLNEKSSVSGSSLAGHSFGDSSGSNASGSSGSFMQIWQWLLLLSLLLCCTGAICGAICGGGKKAKKTKRSSKNIAATAPAIEAPQAVAGPVVEEVAVMEPLIPPLAPISYALPSTMSYAMPSAYAMPAATYAMPAATYAMPEATYAMPATTSYAMAAPVTTAFAAQPTTSYATAAPVTTAFAAQPQYAV